MSDKPTPDASENEVEGGVWVVWWLDWNRMVRSVHATELEAYRAAAEYNDNVEFLAFGANW
jgi:hypothetical protein